MSQTKTWRIVIGVKVIRRSKDGRYEALGLHDMQNLLLATETLERLEVDEFCVIAETADVANLAAGFLNRNGQRYQVSCMDLDEALATFGTEGVNRAYGSLGGFVCRPGQMFSSAGKGWREWFRRWQQRRELKVVVSPM